ncbi:50S ribosomal protein L25/general stress protein Ctc [Rhodocytophaga aerolata]|uniref:Large ribosomal subunit protein bL25 n=1 Tax=Rhodocytophaga aerolata TaxID=455078 RepID=A0ABT8R6S5_9BACT|nr:50S ribosomal protein L25/general stress protein Ctc [Rhodocytophaga aerolata]MDO1447787.1 50S ribosomal protein L25/general stress protein Ctc [Rhodocytophaga aerolata]
MKTLEIIGYKRANLGKKASNDLRLDGYAPCVLYGGKDQVHFYTPMILFKELLYTPNVYQVALNIEGEQYKAVLQDAQFHPVNEVILHVDFLELQDDKPVKMEVPIQFTGVAPGVQKGGKLVSKLRKLAIKALPNDIPDYITVDISNLDLGKSIKTGEIKPENYTVLSNPNTPIATVEIPRALRGKGEEGGK